MEKQIKSLKVQIDVLAKIVKQLEPFRKTFVESELEFYNKEDIIGQSPICRVQKELSRFELYKYNFLVRTDTGTYRWGKNNEVFRELENSGIDLNSKEINHAYNCLLMAKYWLEKANVNDYLEDLYFIDNLKEQSYGSELLCFIENIEYVAKKLDNIPVDKANQNTLICIDNCYKNLIEAVFWLGVEFKRYFNNNELY